MSLPSSGPPLEASPIRSASLPTSWPSTYSVTSSPTSFSPLCPETGDAIFSAARVMLVQDNSEVSSFTSDSVEASNVTICATLTDLLAGGQGSEGGAAEAGFSPDMEALLIVLLGLMIIITIIGNILVCLSVVLVKKLRNPPNYLLISLAISDLCVATLVMPLALYHEVKGSVWNLGPTLCNMFVAFDVSCCTASILNLCMISIDRYLAITRPLTYGVSATSKRIMSFIVAIWVVSCLISVPPLLVLGNEHGTDEKPSCQVSQNIGYQLYATLGAFYIPLTVMIVMYYKIYIAAKKVVEAELKAQPASSRKRPQHKVTHSVSIAVPEIAPNRKEEKVCDVWIRADGEFCDSDKNGHNKRSVQPTTDPLLISPPASPTHSNTVNGMSITGKGGPAFSGKGVKENLLQPESLHKRSFAESGAIKGCNKKDKKRTSSVLRERKASITLGVIMTAFTVCWLPFFILAVLRPFFPSIDNIPQWISSFALWLGYANSMLNPVIYVTFHQDFRKAFRYLLCLQCSTMGTRLREEAYQSQFGSNSYSGPTPTRHTFAPDARNRPDLFARQETLVVIPEKLASEPGHLLGSQGKEKDDDCQKDKEEADEEEEAKL